MPSEERRAWLKKMRPKWSLSGNTSACLGKLAPPESTKEKNRSELKKKYIYIYILEGKCYFTQKINPLKELTQIYAWKMVLLCNLLGTQVLLHRDRIIGSTFDSSIIHNYNTFHPVRCKNMVLWTINSCILLTDVTMHTHWLYCVLLTLTPGQYQWLCLLQEPPLYHITDSQQTGKTQ